MTTTKEQLHKLVDELPESSSGPAVQVLEYLRDDPELVRSILQGLSDPVLRALLTAPIDDEPETSEERAAVAEGREAWRRGELVSDAELVTPIIATTELNSLADTSYRLVRNLPITILLTDGLWKATEGRTAIFGIGQSPTEAVADLEQALLTWFDYMCSNRSALDDHLIARLAYLEKYIQPV